MPDERHDKIRRIGFVGTGVMGASMARRLLDAGYSLTVHTRTRAKAAELESRGAAWAPTAGKAAAEADMVITIVGLPADVRAVYLDPGGVVARARPGTVLVDMTTSEPALAKEIHKLAAGRALHSLDAPVSGGDVGARDGTLSIMVGGDETAFERVGPVLGHLGKTIVLQGGPGSGQHTKMANQIAIASTVIGVMEALAYVRRAGLDPERVLASIGAGAAGSWTMNNLYPRVVRGDVEPGFLVRHFLKDMGIASGEAGAMALALPGLALARRLYGELEAAGGGELGTQAIYRILDPDSLGSH